MKKVLSSLLLIASLSYAADFACIDSQKIITQSKYVAKAQEEFRALMDKYQKELTERQKKIEQLRKELQQGVLSESAKKKKEQEIQKLEREMRELQLEAQENLNKKKDELEEKLFTRVQTIVSDIAKKRNLKAVVDCGTMIYYSPEVDITSEVLKELDASQ